MDMNRERIRALLRRIMRILGVLSGITLGSCCAIWVGFAAYGMDTIRVGAGENDPAFVWEGWSLTAPRWFAILGMYSLAFPLCSAVFPRSRRDGLPVGVAAWLGLLTLGCGHMASNLQFMFRDPAGCTYDGCWPAGWEQLMASTPLLITLLVWTVLSLLAHRIRPAVRLAVPPLLFLALSIALAAVWRPHIVPILLGPPPF